MSYLSVDAAAPALAPEFGRFEAFPQLETGSHVGRVVQLLVAPHAEPARRRLVSAGDTTLRVWNLAKPQAPRLERLLLGRVNGPTDDGAIDGHVARQTISRDGKWVVALKPWRHRFAGGTTLRHDAGRVTELQVFELATGNLQTRSIYPGQLLDLEFSPDGRWLAAVANVRDGARRQVKVLLWPARELLRPGAHALPPAQAELALGSARRASTVPAALRFAPPDPDAPKGEATLVVAVAYPAGAPGQLHWLQLAADGGLGLVRSADVDESITPETLAVGMARAVVGAASPSGRGPRGRGPRRRGPGGRLHAFEHTGGESMIDLEAPVASAAFSPSGQRLAVGLMVEPDGGEDAASGTQTVQVNVYDVAYAGASALCSSYYGHDGTVLALCFVDDAVVASAGGDNNAIHFWRHDRRVAEAQAVIRGVGRSVMAPGITSSERVVFGTVPQRLLPPGHPVRQQSFDLRHMVLSTTQASDVRYGDSRSRKWQVGSVDDIVIPLWFRGDDDDPHDDPTGRVPDLNLFVGADDTWVLWTRSGYYNAGGPGSAEDAARRIGYRVNRGLHQEALLVPCDRFKAFYSPRIVRAVVSYGSEERARARGVDIPSVEVAHILPPIAELARNGIRSENGTVSLSFEVQVPCIEYPPTRASLLRNGRVVWMDRATPARALPHRIAVPSLTLVPGDNRFAFHIESEQAKSVPVEFEVEGPQPKVGDAAEVDLAAPGRLFLLSVGVSEFADISLKALHCPHFDARAVFDAFAHGRLVKKAAALEARPGKRRKDSVNRAFDSVDAKLLINQQATKATILSELERMCASIRQRHAQAGTERDVLFVFLAGHGIRVEETTGVQNLFFSNHDIVLNEDEVDGTGLSMLDLGDRITSVPAEVVLVIDACHAALAGRTTMSGLDAEELARRVHAIYERGMYLVTAARNGELAREDGHSFFGVLTAALLEALDRSRPRSSRRSSQAGAVRTSRRAGAGTAGRRLDVLMADLVAGVQRHVPAVSARTGVAAQTPVCRIYGDLLPLTILRT